MKRCIALCMIALCLLLAGCANEPLGAIRDAVRAEITDAQTQETVVIEEEPLRQLREHLLSLKLRKMDYNEPTILVCTIVFYDGNGEKLEKIDIPAHDWIGCAGSFYSVADGEAEMAQLREWICPN